MRKFYYQYVQVNSLNAVIEAIKPVSGGLYIVKAKRLSSLYLAKKDPIEEDRYIAIKKAIRK
jgi:hypothetical protein